MSTSAGLDANFAFIAIAGGDGTLSGLFGGASPDGSPVSVGFPKYRQLGSILSQS